MNGNGNGHWDRDVLPGLSVVIVTASRVFGVSVEDLLGVSRQRTILEPRQAAMVVCRHRTVASYPEIGRAFHRDHTTVMHALAKVKHDTFLQAASARLEAQCEEPQPPVVAGPVVATFRGEGAGVMLLAFVQAPADAVRVMAHWPELTWAPVVLASEAP